MYGNNFPEYYFAITPELEEVCSKNNLNPDIFLPSQANKTDTGYDVRTMVSVDVRPFEYFRLNLGIKAFCPDGWWLDLRPRSSMFNKHLAHCHYGVIDESFPRNIQLLAQYIPEDKLSVPNLKFEIGDKVGQLIPVRRQEMMVIKVTDEDITRMHNSSNSTRTGGFGSTGGYSNKKD